MAKQSANGSGPAERASRNGSEPDDDPDTGTAFERFERLTRKVVNTPKSAVDKQLAERAKREKRATSSRS